MNKNIAVEELSAMALLLAKSGEYTAANLIHECIIAIMVIGDNK